MVMKNKIIKTIEDKMNVKVLNFVNIGKGGTSNVYMAELKKSPFKVAIKVANKDIDLLLKESEYIKYISSRIDIKLPIIYLEHYEKSIGFVVMEHFNGHNCGSNYVLNASLEHRQKVAKQIADNILSLQKIKGENFGDLLNPESESWEEYYYKFVEKVAHKSKGLFEDGLLTKEIFETIKNAKDAFWTIFNKPVKEPTMIHGDYWAENNIVDDNFNLIGVVDPFNCMWADPEYELFALNAIHGDRLDVLGEYLKEQKVSENFNIKNCFYLLFSETYFVVKLRHDNIDYLTEITRNYMKWYKKLV